MIEIVGEVASTNAELLARRETGRRVCENHWLVADRQSAGRGRGGRSWQDRAGNFMGSTVVNLLPHDPPPQTLALVAGVAAARTVGLASAGTAIPSLKWPNDLLLGGAKLGGILLERRADAVVVGVGINLAAAPRLADRATTCLAEHGCTADRDGFAELLAVAWESSLHRWHGGGWPALREAWQRHAHPPGTRLRVHDGSGAPLEGVYVGIGDAGAAHLRLADGSSRVIHAGDVELVGGRT